jgi:Ca2+-binding RTX toxin-like protein
MSPFPFTDPRDAFFIDPGPEVSTEPTEGDDYIDIPELLPGGRLPFEAEGPVPFVDALGGDDTLYGGEGEGYALAGAGDDVLIGSLAPADGRYVERGLYGQDGNDTLYSGNAFTQLNGGLGDDEYHLFPTGSEIQSHSVDETFEPGVDPSVPVGGGFDTVFLYGQDVGSRRGVERIVAVEGAGTMWVQDGTGNDTELVGNEGRNVMIGYGGTDVMTGGAGRDVFCVAKGSFDDAPFDLTITDLESRDRLLFDDRLFGDAASFRADPRAADWRLGNRLLEDGTVAYDAAAGTIEIDTTGDGALDSIVRFTPGTELTYDDLMLA